MPKNTPSRIIDNRQARAVSFLGGGGSASGVTMHSALGGLTVGDDHTQYLLRTDAATTYAPLTRAVTAGDGLTGTGTLAADLTLAVGAGNLITVAADSVAVANGTGAYQFIGTGSGTTAGWHWAYELAGDGLTHSTALNVGVSGLGLSVGADAVTLTSSSNPGAAASILASDAAGALALTKLRTPLVDTASGNLVLQPAGDLVLDPVGNDVFPQTNYDINLGSLSLKYLSLHAAELWVETLVAQSTIATIGGRILVGPTTTLTRDLASGATTIYVKHNQMASGDRTYMEADGKVEFFAITSSATNTGTDYSYTVTRNLDGTGANQWYAGDAMFNTGQTGNGFIDIYSVRGVKAGTEYGPTIVGNVRLSSTYNDWAPRWAIGNLNGLYGYSTNIPGVALGNYSAANVTVDATNGVRLRQSTTDMIVLDASGNSYFAGVMTIGTSGEIRQGTGTLGSNYTGLRVWRDSSIGRIGGYNSNTLQWWAGTDGKLYAGNGYVGLNRDGAQIDRTTWTYTDAIPEPGYGSTPDLSPSAETTLQFRDQAATFTRTGAPYSYSYPGNTLLRMYASSKHIIPTGNVGDWAHYIDGVIEVPAITEAGDPAVYTRSLRLIAPAILLTGPVTMSGSAAIAGGVSIRQHTTMEQWSIDCANGTALTMANTYVFQFSDASAFSGLVIVTNTTDGGGGVFMCAGGQVVKIADGSSVYSTTKDTASKTNVYYDAGSTEYRMQNNTGGSRTYQIFSIRTRASS